MAWFNSKLRLLLEPINLDRGGSKHCYSLCQWHGVGDDGDCLRRFLKMSSTVLQSVCADMSVQEGACCRTTQIMS